MAGRRIARKYYLKYINTLLLLFFTSMFHWVDKRYFKGKIRQYKFKAPPVFIIGHWRSGTTFLQNLMARDPEFGFTTTYHAVFPNNLRSKWLFKRFMSRFMPDKRPGDGVTLDVDLPQEDEYALSNITARSYYHFFYFPSAYKRMYDENVDFANDSHSSISRWQHQYRDLVAQSLINTNGNRALIKNPVNTGRISLLLDIFPDAQFIFLVRNPILVYLSSKKFFSELLLSTGFEVVSDRELSECIVYIYRRLMHDYIESRGRVDNDRIIEVRFEELMLDPLTTLNSVYSKFKFENFDKLKTEFEQYVSSQKAHKMNRYSIKRGELEYVGAQFEFAMSNYNYTMPDDIRIID